MRRERGAFIVLHFTVGETDGQHRDTIGVNGPSIKRTPT